MSESTRQSTLVLGQAAPEAPFLDSSGKPHSLKDLLTTAKGLPLLLAFFKVSCPTCQLTWPYLQKLHALWGGRAVRVAGVCQNTAAEGKAYFREYGKATFDLFVDPAPRFAASNAYGVEAVPHLVLVSAGGKVQKLFAGWSKRDMETLSGEIAEAKGLVPKPLVPSSDPVADWKAG
jgi:peroxiredoxin